MHDSIVTWINILCMFPKVIYTRTMSFMQSLKFSISWNDRIYNITFDELYSIK